MTLIDQLQDPIVWMGLLLVIAASKLAVIVLGISYVRGLDLESELGRAFVRGFVQVLAMGAFIGILFSLPIAWSAVVILAMIGAAAWISKDRGEGIPEVLRASVVSIFAGAGLVIVTMLAAGAIEPTFRNLIPALE